IKYAMPNEAPVISITSRIIEGSNQLIYTDNGLGFDMDNVGDKIFGLNQKFHHNGDSKGVGLYLVYNHITSLGGKISVESEINKGTTFTITFKSKAGNLLVWLMKYSNRDKLLNKKTYLMLYWH
ncbi:MAG: ATP-binding protein, partial [Arenibacter sp.]